MSNQIGCIFCTSSDPQRKKEGKIRCTAFSEWREPLGNICNSYFERGTAEMLNKIAKMKGVKT